MWQEQRCTSKPVSEKYIGFQFSPLNSLAFDFQRDVFKRVSVGEVSFGVCCLLLFLSSLDVLCQRI